MRCSGPIIRVLDARDGKGFEMICANRLDDDWNARWSMRHGMAHGPLNTAWSNRNGRDLFRWSIQFLSGALQAQQPDAEVELVEDDDKRPIALIVCGPADSHRILDVEMLGSLVRLRDNGAVVASAAVCRPHHAFTAGVAKAVAKAAKELGSGGKNNDFG
jgi:hypothetical protein